MPKANAVIGRLAIKVLPDTSSFKEKARAELERIARNLDVKVPVDLVLHNANRLKTQIKAVAESASADAKVGLDVEKARADLAKIDHYLSNLEIKPELDADAVRRVKKEAERLLLRQRDLRLSYRVEMDPIARRRTSREIEEIQRKLNKLEDDIKPNIKPEYSSTRAKIVAGLLGLLSRPRTALIRPEIEKAAAARVTATLAALSGARVIDKYFNRIWDSLKNLDKGIPIIASLTLGFTALAGWSLAAVSNISALGLSLAQIGPAALALPGILGGITVGLAATAIAFADFNKKVPEVKTAWEKLRKTISDNFWAKAQKPIKEMIDGLLPEFVSGFEGASTQLGGFFGQLATGLKTSFKGPLKQMFGDLSKSISIASGSTGALARLIADLGSVGAGYLPRLATWFSNVTTKFSNFIHTAKESGKLNDWIDAGIDNVKALGSSLWQTGRILGGFAKAADKAGGSSLQSLAATLKSVADAVNGVTFQDSLVRVLQSAHEAMHNIASQSGPAVKQMFLQLSHTLADILPNVGTTLGRVVRTLASTLASADVQKGIKSLFSGVESGVESILPALQRQLGPALRSLGELIGTLAKNFGPVLGSAIDAIGPSFNTLAAAAGRLSTTLGPALSQAITEAGPSLTRLAEALAKVADSLGPSLASAIQQALPVLKGLLDLASKIVSALAPVAPAILGVYAAFKVFSGVQGIVKKVTAALVAYNTKTLIAAGSAKKMAKEQATATAGLSNLGTKIGRVAAALGPIGVFMAAGYALGKTISNLTEGQKGKDWDNLGTLGEVVKSLRTEVVNANGAIDDNVKSLLQQRLAADGVAAALAKTGLTTQQAITALTGSKDAAEKVIKEWHDAGKITSGQAIDLLAIVKALNDAQGDVPEAAKKAAEALKDQGEAAETAAGKLKSVNDEIAKLNKDASVEGSRISAAQAINAASDALRENGSAMKGNTKEALANNSAILSAYQSALQYSQQLFEQTGSSKEAGDALAAMKQQLLDTLASQGLLTQGVKDYIDQIFKTPKFAKTQFDIDKEQAQKDAEDYLKSIGAIPSKRLTKFDVSTSEAVTALKNLKTYYDVLTNKTITISVNGKRTGIGGGYDPEGSAADGATVMPKPGGTLIQVAEAGKAETIVDTGKMNRLIDKALGGNLAGSSGPQINKTFVYNAAPRSPGFSSREELLGAIDSSRAAGW